MTEETKTIWVLGGHATNADRSIPWQVDIPNLSNPDLLIIDLNTIPAGIKLSIPHYEIRDYIRYSLMAVKDVIVIVSSDFEDWEDPFPVFPKIEKIKPCEFSSINPRSSEMIPEEMIEYSKYVEHCDFFIDFIDTSVLWNMLSPYSDWGYEKYPFTDRIMSIFEYSQFELLNVARQPMGLSARYIIRDVNLAALHITGVITFLPPPTIITSSEGVEVLVNTLRGEEFKEEEPDWVSGVELPGVGELDGQISEIENLMEKKQEEMQILRNDKKELVKHLKLLWTSGNPLENAVRDALSLLGFSEIQQGRSRELEDFVIDIQTSAEYIHGVIEVKGKERRSSITDLNQCFRWVNEYRVQEGKKVKGIFLPNQHRRTEPLDSLKRLHFEPNEISLAKDYELCILPTSELFKAVSYVLDGNTLSREEIENKMLEANPICKLVS